MAFHVYVFSHMISWSSYRYVGNSDIFLWPLTLNFIFFNTSKDLLIQGNLCHQFPSWAILAKCMTRKYYLWQIPATSDLIDLYHHYYSIFLYSWQIFSIFITNHLNILSHQSYDQKIFIQIYHFQWPLTLSLGYIGTKTNLGMYMSCSFLGLRKFYQFSFIYVDEM